MNEISLLDITKEIFRSNIIERWLGYADICSLATVSRDMRTICAPYLPILRAIAHIWPEQVLSQEAMKHSRLAAMLYLDYYEAMELESGYEKIAKAALQNDAVELLNILWHDPYYTEDGTHSYIKEASERIILGPELSRLKYEGKIPSIDGFYDLGFADSMGIKPDLKAHERLIYARSITGPKDFECFTRVVYDTRVNEECEERFTLSPDISIDKYFIIENFNDWYVRSRIIPLQPVRAMIEYYFPNEKPLGYWRAEIARAMGPRGSGNTYHYKQWNVPQSWHPFLCVAVLDMFPDLANKDILDSLFDLIIYKYGSSDSEMIMAVNKIISHIMGKFPDWPELVSSLYIIKLRSGGLSDDIIRKICETCNLGQIKLDDWTSAYIIFTSARINAGLSTGLSSDDDIVEADPLLKGINGHVSISKIKERIMRSHTMAEFKIIENVPKFKQYLYYFGMICGNLDDNVAEAYIDAMGGMRDVDPVNIYSRTLNENILKKWLKLRYWPDMIYFNLIEVLVSSPFDSTHPPTRKMLDRINHVLFVRRVINSRITQ